MAFRDQPLGELALTIPRASALFRQYDMDYCCGGKQTLARAASRKALDVAVIEAELAKLAEQASLPRLAHGAPRGDYRPYHRSLSRPAP
ncbi:nitric oxide-dependent regulator DnrN or NorA [Klebsiella pneumoniae]|uniref:Nitric oxide-dependent regulator DnrN or NorA n=1 Tax=Klebsiella pneumoniae TaxID=573 RepID=A0A378FX23_KLEPN|nr:nitric oxide-dependent regulator DnrN or NorA [Klebsiella pneumoniae]